MKAFNIQIHSPLAFIGVFSAVMIAGTAGMRSWLSKVDPIVAGTLVVIVFACGFFLASRLSNAKIHIKIDESGFHHLWVKRFIFSREPDIHLFWDQVVDYFFEEDRTYYKFQLTLEHKQRYRFYRQTIWPVKDDFHRFQRTFPKLLRNVGTTEAQQIVLGKTIYEERWFKWVLLFMSILVLLLLVSSAIHGEDGSNWGVLGMLAAAMIFYWIRVRTKGKSE
jgi:hypothetical protein